MSRFKFLLLFVIFTFALYHFMVLVSSWLEPPQKYREPAGKAVKVFHHQISQVEKEPISERLKLFYWYGE